MYSTTVQQPPIPGQGANDKGTYGVNDYYNAGKTPNVSNRVGVRPRAPTAVQTLRRPIQVLNVRIGNNTTGAAVDQFLSTGQQKIENVVGIYLSHVHLSGYSNTAFTGSNNNAFISFASTNFNNLRTVKTINVGSTGLPTFTDGFSVPIVPASTDTIEFYNPSKLIGLFQQTQSITNISVQVLDSLGNPVPCSEVFLCLEIETEDWQ